LRYNKLISLICKEFEFPASDHVEASANLHRDALHSAHNLALACRLFYAPNLKFIGSIDALYHHPSIQSDCPSWLV